jgi:hypothetical protein
MESKWCTLSVPEAHPQVSLAAGGSRLADELILRDGSIWCGMSDPTLDLGNLQHPLMSIQFTLDDMVETGINRACHGDAAGICSRLTPFATTPRNEHAAAFRW